MMRLSHLNNVVQGVFRLFGSLTVNSGVNKRVSDEKYKYVLPQPATEGSRCEDKQYVFLFSFVCLFFFLSFFSRTPKVVTSCQLHWYKQIFIVKMSGPTNESGKEIFKNFITKIAGSSQNAISKIAGAIDESFTQNY